MELRSDRKAAGIVALVGSAGGLTAVESVLSRLPADLPSRSSSSGTSCTTGRVTPRFILARHTPLVVKEAEDGDVLEGAHVYVASPDAHLLVQAGGILELDRKRAAVNFNRPSANVLLPSVVSAYDGRVVVAVLSGMGSDGASGAEEVHAAGGAVLAQDEASAVHHGMPAAAIATGAVDRVLAPTQIADAIIADVGAVA
jgi:two-component system chemotaxis response regulator CheB